MLAFSLCKAAIFTLSLNINLQAAAAAMADLEALSALSAALATSIAAALISLLELFLKFYSNSGLGKNLFV